MKPFSKSVWMTPAACGAFVPRRICHARDLLRARREVRDQPEQRVGRLDEARQAVLVLARRREKLGAVLGRQVGELRLELGRDHDDARALRLGPLADAVDVGVAVRQVALGRRWRRTGPAWPSAGTSRGRSRPPASVVSIVRTVLPVAEVRVEALEDGRLGLGALSPPRASLALRSRRFSTVSRSFSISSVSIVSMSRSGSTRALDVDDVRVLEAAHDVDDGVDLADVGQKLVAQPLALGGARDEARRCRRTRWSPGRSAWSWRAR